jgi:flagellar biogenesis protein FliO
MADDNEQIEVSATEARAGSTPHMTRYILPMSLVLVIVIFAILLFARQ